jgi:hypothetical protein
VPVADWPSEAREQLRWHWEEQLRPRLNGLSDDEYLWEPARDSWSIRPRGESRASIRAGSGALTIDLGLPEPDPPPVTTIAWRLGHLIVAAFRDRIATYFGGSPINYHTFTYAGTAEEALAQLDTMYEAWSEGVRSLGTRGLEQPCGPIEHEFADRPLAGLVLHSNREVIHHGAEIALLRDLYRRRGTTNPSLILRDPEQSGNK